MQIVVDDLLTQYELKGAGRLIVLLHGWGDSSKGLLGLQDALSADYKVLSIDLPGFGATQPPKQSWDLDSYSEFVAHLLDKLQLGTPYALVGHSNGGGIVIRAVASGKLNANKLVLLAASGIRNKQSARRIVLAALAKTGRAATFWLPSSKRDSLRSKLYGMVGSDLLVAPGMEETFKLVVKQDLQNDAKQITRDTLLIYGDGDTATPASYGRGYHELIRNSELKVLHSGHFVHLEQQHQVVEEIQEFLK